MRDYMETVGKDGGDPGYGESEIRRCEAILNAYLVPDSVRQLLYPSISPVNSFRAIMSGLLGERNPLLPDRSFFNWYPEADAPALRGQVDELRDVTEIVRSRD